MGDTFLISGLKQKRAAMAGRIVDLRREADKLQSELVHVDAVLSLDINVTDVHQRIADDAIELLVEERRRHHPDVARCEPQLERQARDDRVRARDVRKRALDEDVLFHFHPRLLRAGLLRLGVIELLWSILCSGEQ